jgi:flagellar hook-length control protein FliK
VPLRNPDKVAQETGSLHQVPAGENSMSELVASVTPGSVKAPSTLDSGGNMPGNGKEGAERDFSGHGHLFIQPPKAEQAASSVNPISGDLRESLTKESMEHVVQQVKEHLAGRDYKTGTDQVTIRLNPEHMGELKLNLRMENQQLKVEIVAENASVRDALLKHSDSLREALAKQNISMESFDVTTGGKGSGNQGHNQSAWRELAKQQQQQPYWASASGYNIAQADIPSGQAAYQRQQGHSMLDIHY